MSSQPPLLSVLPVIYVNKGIANRFENRIELHEKLKQYPELHDEILKHERSHMEGNYSLTDFSLDFSNIKNNGQYYRFLFSTPSAWWQYLPIYRSQGNWYIDYSILINFVIAAGVTGLIIWLIIKYLI